MAAPARLTEPEIDTWLVAHPLWERNGLFLERTVAFADFGEAFGFMTRVAIMADRAGHHPDWSNVYNKVNIALTTHDAGGLTLLDTTFAESVENILGSEAQ